MEPIVESPNHVRLSVGVYENIYNSMPYDDDDSDDGASMIREVTQCQNP